MIFSISLVAVWCRSASSRSLVRRATLASSTLSDDRGRGAIFGLSRRFGFAAIGRRVLARMPLTLARFFIAPPVSHQPIVAREPGASEGPFSRRSRTHNSFEGLQIRPELRRALSRDPGVEKPDQDHTADQQHPKLDMDVE